MAIDKEKTLQAAQKAVEKKKFDVAIDEYRKLAAVEKADMRWLLKIGDTQQKKGDFPAAIATYEEVARFYGSQGFHLKAVAVYNTVRDLLNKQAPTLQQKYAHVPVKLAELYEKLQLTSDALATWDSIAERLQRENRDKEAVDVYKRIVGLDPSNPLAHLRLAEALSRVKDIEGAIAEFAATAEQLTAQKRIDDALKVYERLLHHRQDPKYARPAAELYLQRGGPSDGVAAIAKIQICLKSDSKSVELIALLARGFAAIGQPDKAVTIYKEAQRLAGDQQKTDLRKEIVKRLAQLAPNDEAVRALYAEVIQGIRPAAASSAGSQMPAGRHQTDGSLQQQSQPQQPQRAAQQQPQQQPQRAAQAQQQPQAQARPQPTRAQEPPPSLSFEEEDEELEAVDEDELDFDEREAAEEIHEAPKPPQRKAPSIVEVMANADAFRKVKLFSKALTTLRIGLDLDPRSVPVRERIRDILIETGETDQAIAEMVTLSTILVEDNDLEGAYDNLAWILEAEEGHPQATRLMEQVQRLAHPDEEIEPAEEIQAGRTQQSHAARFDELDE
ncbi:MAG: tetratricopeptide repeat protein, partial [Polyangiales bacterium]